MRRLIINVEKYREVLHEDIELAKQANNSSIEEEFFLYAASVLMNGEEFDDFTECHFKGVTRRNGNMCTDFLQQLFGNAYLQLNSAEQIILATAQLEKEVSNSRLQAMLDLHSTEVGKLLSDLVGKEMLIAKWRGRWTTYTININYEKEGQQINLLEIDKSPIKLNKSDAEIYNYIQSNEFITLEQIIAITRITTKQGALKAIDRLEKKGLIFRDKEGKGTFYRA